MVLNPNIIKAYNDVRNCSNKKVLCHAPFANLNFEQSGLVRACCYNSVDILGKWPEQSIKEIWAGANIQTLRGHIELNQLEGGCSTCASMIEAGDFRGVRARYFDDLAVNPLKEKALALLGKKQGKTAYPKAMEFEISNTCNLECLMCNGNFSSSIRRNREKLPPINSPYNDSFVTELEEFIPHLTDAKFLGGEPFMIDIYSAIWERILKINPKIKIHITTNGTLLNSHVKSLLEGLRAGIVVSMDSINQRTYETIRVNGNYNRVMENLEYFIDYSKRKGTFISLAACPITLNWHELPQILEFCLAKDIRLHFNPVFYPKHLSLQNLTIKEFEEVISFLEGYNIPDNIGHSIIARTISIDAYNGYVALLNGWLKEKKENAAQEEISKAKLFAPVWSISEILKTIEEVLNAEVSGSPENLAETKKRLLYLFSNIPEGKIAGTLYCFMVAAAGHLSTQPDDAIMNKLNQLALEIEKHPARTEILSQISQAPPLYFTEIVSRNSSEELNRIFHDQFSKNEQTIS